MFLYGKHVKPYCQLVTSKKSEISRKNKAGFLRKQRAKQCHHTIFHVKYVLHIISLRDHFWWSYRQGAQTAKHG